MRRVGAVRVEPSTGRLPIGLAGAVEAMVVVVSVWRGGQCCPVLCGPFPLGVSWELALGEETPTHSVGRVSGVSTPTTLSTACGWASAQYALVQACGGSRCVSGVSTPNAALSTACGWVLAPDALVQACGGSRCRHGLGGLRPSTMAGGEGWWPPGGCPGSWLCAGAGRVLGAGYHLMN